MKRVAVLIALGLLAFGGTVRADDTLWTRVSGVAQSGAGMAVTCIGSDIYAAGTVTTLHQNILLVKYLSNGDSVWSRVLKIVGKTVGVAVGPDSAPVVCAVSTDLPSTLLLAKFNKNGDTLWTRSRLDFLPTGVAVNTSNEIFVYGSSGGPVAGESLALVKYSVGGAPQFDHAWQLGTNYATGGCACDANGNLVGGVIITLGGTYLTLLKFDGLGDTLWSQRYGALPGEEVQGVAVEPNGCIVLVDKPGTTLRVEKFTPTGSQLWNNTIPGSGATQLYANIAVDADSNIAVPVTDSLSHGTVCVLDAQGNQRALLTSYSPCQLQSVTLGSDGLPVAVGGPTPPLGCLTIKFSASVAIAEPANPATPGAGHFLTEGILGPGQAIALSVPRAGSYAISILSENGALVRRVNRAYLAAGEFQFAPGRLAAGSYYLRIAGPAGTVQEKFIQLR